MDNLIAIELKNEDHHDIIEPFLSITPSFKERHQQFYIFSSIVDIVILEKELVEFSIIESVHTLFKLENPILYDAFNDYGFSTNSNYYLFTSMTLGFTITKAGKVEKEMALLQFLEHLIAHDGRNYFIDHHHHDLITKIASSYNIAINLFELDKLQEND
ncbi:hypothetical protein [Bacillus sp. AK128]